MIKTIETVSGYNNNNNKQFICIVFTIITENDNALARVKMTPLKKD